MAVVTETFPPAPSGMNVALSGQEIDDTEAQYLQDILLDKPGYARRRGQITRLTTWKELPRKASGLVLGIDPTGSDKYAALTGNSSNGYLTMWSADKTTVTDYAWVHALPTEPITALAQKYRHVVPSPALNGGTWVGTASEYDANSSLQALGLWYGANYNTYSTGTVSFTRGSAAVTGSGTSWSTNVSPGQFLFSNTTDASAGNFTSAFIGVVLSVNSDTSITLEQNAPYTGSAETYSLTPVRGFIPKVVKGQITCATDSTTVSGGGTKFSSQGLGSGTWNIYRASDFAWVGKVSSVASDISLTLAANAAYAMSDERYVAIKGDWTANDKSLDVQLSSNKAGWLTAVYAERQWYANNGTSFDKTYRLWYSDTSDKEGVDLSNDGDWIPISAAAKIPEPIRMLVATYNSLLVLKENESYAVYGTSPSSFSAKKLEDDGTLSAMSVQPYGGGAIWAGRDGLYYYNGVEVTNLMRNKFGDVWKTTMATVDTNRYRMWSTIIREHYFLFIEDLDPAISTVKGNSTATPDHWVVVVNMNTQAITLHTNLKFHGSVLTPASDNRKTRLVVNGADPDLAASNWGKTAAGASQVELVPDRLYALPVTVTTGYLGFRTVKVRLDGGGTGTGNANFKVAIYSDSSGDPGTLLASSAAVTVTDVAAAADVEFTLSDDLWFASGTTFWIVLQGDSNADSCQLYYDSSSNVSRYIAGDYAVTGFPTTWNAAGDTLDDKSATAYIVYAGSTGLVIDGDNFFDGEGLDEFPTEYGTVRGPDFYMVTKKYNAGNDVQLKRFKQFAIHYLAQGGALNVDTVLGLNEVGQTLSTQLPSSVLTWDNLRTLLPNWSSVAEQYPAWDNLISGVFRPKRARFLKKDHLISFRLHQASATMTRAKVGPFHIAYKLMRPTRVT